MSSFMANLIKFKSYTYESSVPVRKTPPKKHLTSVSKQETKGKLAMKPYKKLGCSLSHRRRLKIKSWSLFNLR